MTKLLTRDEFRVAVFARDSYKCVYCGEKAQDAHHIIERRLWSDGGYYLENGASVCGLCHLMCEETTISVEEIREAAKITKVVIPPHLYADHRYDKWGNPIQTNGSRLKGELFYDESVQKVLSGVLHLFVDYVKYPRTHHLPWSQNVNDDDRVIQNLNAFHGKKVVVTEKMDGENTSMYSDHIHARSVESSNHPSRSWVKQFWSTIAYDIPRGWRVCGENLYAKHSIHYDSLPSYFMGFSIWDDQNNCLDWNTTLEWFEIFGITPVPVLYYGIFDETLIRSLPLNWGTSEGYVVRSAETFNYKDFKNRVAKFVRKDHIQTVKHWMHGQAVEKNLLRIEND